MRWLRWIGLLAAFTNCACAALPLRDGWSFVPGAQDLIRSGNWGCLSQVSASEGAITISAGTGFNTVINTTGPLLQVQGDVSILATLATPASGGTYLTLVGTLNTGDWWSGLKRLDVGVAGGVQVNYWTGSSPNAVAQTLPLPPGGGDSVNLEVARVGNQFVVFVNGVETGRVADPGIFASGRVYLGFNVAPGSRLTVLALAAAQPSDTVTKASLAAPYLQVAERSGTALRDVAERRGFLVGAAVNPTLFGETGYAQTLGREFNLVVAENAMKFAATEPALGRFSFCQGDQIVAFAEANGMKVRGHTLVWQQSLPNWLTSGGFSSAEAGAI